MRKLKHEEIPRVSPAELAEIDRHPITVIIENVRSAYNVGSILRTCDAALVERVIVAGYTPAPDHPKVQKTALGAQDGIAWDRTPTSREAVQHLRGMGYTIAVLEITDGSMLISDLQAEHFPIALLIGNEVTGVTDEMVATADIALEIPQYGSKQSLNVGVAFGIAVMGAVDRFRSIHPKHP